MRLETGACFCGGIAAELRGEPFWIRYDHDDDCRRAVGGPMMLWVGYRPNEFHLITGEWRSFSRTAGVTRSFCPNCGSCIAYRDEGIEDELYVAIGFFHHPERFVPTAHAYWGLRLPYLRLRDNLPKIDRYSRPRDPAIGFPVGRSRA